MCRYGYSETIWTTIGKDSWDQEDTTTKGLAKAGGGERHTESKARARGYRLPRLVMEVFLSSSTEV